MAVRFGKTSLSLLLGSDEMTLGPAGLLVCGWSAQCQPASVGMVPSGGYSLRGALTSLETSADTSSSAWFGARAVEGCLPVFVCWALSGGISYSVAIIPRRRQSKCVSGCIASRALMASP